jgi:hypothetical protein
MAVPDQQDRAQSTARDANKANVHDPTQLDDALKQSREGAEGDLEELEKALQEQLSDDDWTTPDTTDVVRFHDIRKADVVPTGVSGTDEATVRQLRTHFERIKGRAESTLDSSGAEVDVQAYIQRRASRSNHPVFLADKSGRGFKCLLLLDRSGTMTGAKSHQVERAYALLSKALDFPAVDLRGWGFQSLNYGQVDIQRFERRLPRLESEKAPVTGFSPLHVAIDRAVTELRQGTEFKVLVVLTDGLPEHFNNEGKPYGKEQLIQKVRDTVARAHAEKVRVIGLFIGELERARIREYGTLGSYDQVQDAVETDAESVVSTLVDSATLTRMFGGTQSWKVLDPRTLETDLVTLISRVFTDYLANG